MKVIALVFILVIMLTGCASTVGTFFNRPVVEDSMKDKVSTVSLSADRRTVVVVTEGANSGKFCAEPPPDTANSISASVEAALKAKLKEEGKAEADAEATIKDNYVTTVVKLSERTALLDVYRTGSYSLCQFHLNGALDGKQLQAEFHALTTAVIEKMEKK